MPAVRPEQRPVLVVAELGGPEPQRAVRLVREPALPEALDGRGDLALSRQVRFRDVGVESHAEAIERAADPPEDDVDRVRLDPASALLRVVDGQVGVTVFGLELFGQVVDVRAEVPVLRYLGVSPGALEVASGHRGSEPVHLSPGVVEVVLPLHLEAGRLEHVGQRVADDRVARVADVERTRGVGRQELDLDTRTGRLGPAVVRSSLQDLAKRVREPPGPQEQVHEAGPGHLDALDHVPRRDLSRQRLRHGPRRCADLRGHHERHVGGPVAVLSHPRP